MITDEKKNTALSVEDPEKAMERELARKRQTLTLTAEVARNEYAEWLSKAHREMVDWSDPVTHWRFNAWIAEQGEREWLSDKQKEVQQKRSQASRSRAVVMAKVKTDALTTKAELAAERKRVADAEYSRIRRENKQKQKQEA